jgi:hypothetical protein
VAAPARRAVHRRWLVASTGRPPRKDRRVRLHGRLAPARANQLRGPRRTRLSALIAGLARRRRGTGV